MIVRQIFTFILVLNVIQFAQSDSLRVYQLGDSIVISANRYASSLRETGASISVITKEDIQHSAKSSLFDLLKPQFGFDYYREGGPGALSTALLRGGNSGSALVLMDGVELNMTNDIAGTVDFSSLALNDVERIEILRGAQSTLYGSNAVSGVINIITQKPAAGFRLSFAPEIGSYASYAFNGAVSGGAENVRASISIRNFSTKGFSSSISSDPNLEPDGVNQFSLNSAVMVQTSPDYTLTLTGRYVQARMDLDQFGGSFGDDPTYKYNLKEYTFRVEGKYLSPRLPFTLTTSASIHSNKREYSFDYSRYNSAYSNSDYDGTRKKIDLQGLYMLSPKRNINFGAEYTFDGSTSQYLYYSQYFTMLSAFPSQNTRMSGAFIQYADNPIENLFFTAGARFDHHDMFGSVTTYRVSPAYIISETNTKIKAAVGTAFKAPSLFNLYDPAYGNRTLMPEKSSGWEAGIVQYTNSGAFEFGAAYFYSYAKNLIGADNAFRAINVNAAIMKGVESNIKFKFAPQYSIDINYTFLETKNINSNSIDNGQPLLYRPKHKASLLLNAAPVQSLNVNIEALYIGTRYNAVWGFTKTYVQLPDHYLVNAAINYRYDTNFLCYARIENLFDRKYEEISGYGTPRFSVYFGIRYELGNEK